MAVDGKQLAGSARKARIHICAHVLLATSRSPSTVNRHMKYTEKKSKHPLLAPHIEYFNSIEGDGNTVKQFISLPEGKVGMVFMLSGHTHNYKKGVYLYNDTHRIVGLIQTPNFIEASDDIFTFCAVFKPGGLWHFLPNIPVNKIADASATLEDIYGKEIYRISDALMMAKDFDERLFIFESFLLRQLKPVINRVQFAVNLVERLNGNLNVAELSSQLNISTRQLRTIFNEKIGLSPKQFIRTIRFKSVLTAPPTIQENMAQFATKIGCYDESHFIHEFKSFAGMTPKKYFENRSFTSDFSNYKRLMID